MKTFVVTIMSCFLFFSSGIMQHDLHSTGNGFKFYSGEKSCIENLHAKNTIDKVLESKRSPSEQLPDITIQLVSGNNKHLQDFIDCKKYIYITFWPNKQAIFIRELKAYDSIAAIYKNKLMVIGLLDNGNVKQLNRLVGKYQLQNLVGVIPEGTMQPPPGKGYPYGMLFSKYGRLINKAMSKEELEEYMKKHVGEGRAKF